MKRWQISVCCVLMFVWRGRNARSEPAAAFLPAKTIINIIPEFFAQSPSTPTTVGVTAKITKSSSKEALKNGQIASSVEPTTDGFYDDQSDAPDPLYPVQHAGIPQGLQAYPLPLQGSDHQLMFNVTWKPPIGLQPRDYSIEVNSVTNTSDCNTPMCYEYNIPGDSVWWVIPSQATSSIAETCAVKPGCSYRVRLLAHPWDGHTAAHQIIQLDECVAGVCSCAHAPRLPSPRVRASAVTIQEELFINVSWSLPPPTYPQRLPAAIDKQYYFVSLGKQMVSDAHPAPWFAYTISRNVDASGPVSSGDTPRWILLPTTEWDGHSDKRSDRKRDKRVPDVKLLARVSLIDDRGCIGPPGNDTAYDPANFRKYNYGAVVLWAVLGGACVLAMMAVLAVGARAVKRVLRALRPRPVSAPLEPLSRRPAWLPMQPT